MTEDTPSASDRDAAVSPREVRADGGEAASSGVEAEADADDAAPVEPTANSDASNTESNGSRPAPGEDSSDARTTDGSAAGSNEDETEDGLLAAAADLVGGDVYDGQGQRLVSFRPDGTIAPNAATVNAYFDGVEGVLLAYDDGEREVSLVLCEEYHDSDEMMQVDTESNRVEITTRSFLDRYDLHSEIPQGNKKSFERTHRFAPVFDKSDRPGIHGVLRIDLSSVEDVYDSSSDD